MNQEFSKTWKGSNQPRKQRKYAANVPLHMKKKFVGTTLSKDLRKNHGKRNVSLRQGDTVKIMRGKFEGKKGKVTKVLLKEGRVYVEGIQIKKMDGSKAEVKLQPSNLQITELATGDRKRKVGKSNSEKSTKTEEKSKETKVDKEKKNAP